MNRCPKILITNQVCQMNMGDAMILNGTLRLLRDVVGEADFTVLSFNPEIDAKRCDVRVVGMVGGSVKSITKFLSLLLRSLLCNLLRTLHLNSDCLMNEYILQQYVNSDVVVVRGGDTLTSDYGMLTLASHLVSIFLALCAKKPIILLGHTIGPFGMLRYVANAIFSRVDVIILREELSREYLQLQGMSRSLVYVTADLAFHLSLPNTGTVAKALLNEGICETERMVGVSISQLAPRFLKEPKGYERRRETYVEKMAQMIDYLVANLDVNVLIVPTVLGPGDNDDRIISKAVLSKVSQKERVRLIVNEHRPDELVGIIGSCEMFVGARMHACIAAMMNSVPTIALAYGHKFDGIIGGILGQTEYVVDNTHLDLDILISKINKAWVLRAQTREYLGTRNINLRKKTLCNHMVLQGFLESLGIMTAPHTIEKHSNKTLRI